MNGTCRGAMSRDAHSRPGMCQKLNNQGYDGLEGVLEVKLTVPLSGCVCIDGNEHIR